MSESQVSNITYTIIYDSCNMWEYLIVYECRTVNCILYGLTGNGSRCINCGHYRKMVKIYTTRPKPPIISIV